MAGEPVMMALAVASQSGFCVVPYQHMERLQDVSRKWKRREGKKLAESTAPLHWEHPDELHYLSDQDVSFTESNDPVE
jgi:hypothetical protein